MSSSLQAAPVRPSLGSRYFPTFVAWIGNLGWPILLRQLRADFRRNRFFLSQLACLSILGATLVVMIANKVDSQFTAAQVGRDLFNTFFILQYLIILITFPAFSSTAFAEERANFTMDLLLTTNLRPAEIVWGKFLASTVYCLMYVMASIPLLSITFLFGGVSLAEVLWAYAIQVGMTLFIAMLGVAISSCFVSSTRATLTLYVLVFLALAVSFQIWRGLPPAGTDGGARASVVLHLRTWLGVGTSDSAVEALTVLFAPIAAFAYLFLIAANRIRPPNDDRSSALRALTLLSILGLLAASAWSKLPRGISTAAGRIPPPPSSLEGFLGTVQLAAILLFAAALVFSTEEAAVSRRNRARFGRLGGLFYPLRIFSPGAFWGFIYSVVLCVLACGGLLALWELELAGGADPRLQSVVRESLLTIPPYVSAFAALGFLLAACDFTPLYSRLTVFFLFIITLLLPVIFMLSKLRDAVWTLYYLSPITLWTSLVEPVPDGDPKFILFGLPVIRIAQGLFLAMTAALAAGGVMVARRAGYPTLSAAFHKSR